MENNDTIDLSKYISAVKRGWYWYVLAFVLFTGLAITYHFMRTDQYAAHSSILIEDEDGQSGGMGGMSSGMQSMMRTFSIGGMGALSIDNEIEIFNSHNTMLKLVKMLQINRIYTERVGIKKFNLYKNSPILVDVPEAMLDTLQRGFKVKVDLHANGTADVKVEQGFFSRTLAKKQGVSLPVLLETELGPVQVLKTELYSPTEERSIKVNVSGNDASVEAFTKLIDIDYLSKKSDGVALETKMPSRLLGTDMLNGLMNIYNDTRINRKNERAEKSVEFYDEMIGQLSAQLGDAERRLENFKTENKLVDIPVQAELTLESRQLSNEGYIWALNQETVFDAVIKFLSQSQNRFEMIPITVADEKSAILIQQYNDLIMSRMSMQRSARENNPSITMLESQIDAMRSTVVSGISQVRQNNLLKLEVYKREMEKKNSLITKMPELEREYLSLMRDKELKNELYLFLLGKRYDNAMTLASSFPRGFVIDPAYTEVKPLMTKSFIAIAAALVLTLLTPTFFIVLWTIFRKEKKPVAA